MKLELFFYASVFTLMVGMPGSLLGMEPDEKASSLQRTAAVASSKQSSTDQQNQLEEAEAWYRKAANRRHVEAMNNLAMLNLAMLLKQNKLLTSAKIRVD